MSEHVRVEQSGGVLAITLARPERRNAITVAMYAALADAIEGAASDAEIRVITIRGEGQDFAAGNDLADFLEARAARRRGNPGVAPAAGAGRMRNPDRRRGSRQLRRHRHDHAAPLRPGDRRRQARASRCRSSTSALVPEAASSLLLAAARRAPARRALPAARRAVRRRRSAWRSASSAIASPPGGLDAKLRRDRRGAARQAAPKRCARPSGCCATARATKSSSG